MPAAAENGAGTRERLVTAGMRLFAERGFQGTTVGEIEQAAGLTPRAGALYNHFGSKEAVLEAAFERHVHELEAIHSAIELMPLGDTRSELTLLTRWGLRMLEREGDLRRIVIREGDRFPELKERYRERIVDRSLNEAVAFLTRKVESGELPDFDVEALSTLVAGALLGYTLEFDVFGRRPLGVDEERFVQTLVETCMSIVDSREEHSP